MPDTPTPTKATPTPAKAASPPPAKAAPAPAKAVTPAPAKTVTRAGPPSMARPPEMLKLSKEKLRLVVFGDPGVGKTTLASTFPRPVFIDTDDGLVTLAVEGIEVMHKEPEGYKDLEGLYWWLKEHRDEFDTIVLDSMTTMQRLLLDELHDMTVATKTINSPVMQYVPEQGEYQANQRQLARVLTDLRRLDAHMVITGGVRDRMGKRAIDVSPGLFGIISHFSSVMAELTTINADKDGKPLPQPKRVLVTGAGPREVKSRFRSLLPYVESPSFDVIWRKVQAQYAAAIKSNNQKESA